LLFNVEAMPSLVLAVVVLKVLRDSPEHAEWLADHELVWLTQTLHDEQQWKVAVVMAHGFFNIVKRPLVLLLVAAYFGIVCFNFGLSFSVVKDSLPKKVLFDLVYRGAC
jgi:MFS transporter, ACS family, tartrate transporter